MDKYKTKMTINKWFSYIKLEQLSIDSRKAIEQFDRYAKKLTFKKAIKLFLYAINDETESLRHLDQQLVNPNLKKVMGIDSISYSTAFLVPYGHLIPVYYWRFLIIYFLLCIKDGGKIERKLYLIDSSTFSFSRIPIHGAFSTDKSWHKVTSKSLLHE